MEHRDVSEVLYLYGFVPAGTTAPPADVGGLADAAVHLLDLGALAAAVAHLPAREFSVDRIEARLDDLAWVGELGLAHERVVVWFADNAEILPARMLSIYSSEAALRAAVAGDLGRLTQKLGALRGMREWNLKVAYDMEELARHGADLSDELRRLDEEISAAPPGRRYLLERRRADRLKIEVTRAARTLADELLTELGTCAADVRTLPVPAVEETGTVVLNAALLVARAVEPTLRERAAGLYDRYTALGMIVSFSGPWAPYRFVEQSDDA